MANTQAVRKPPTRQLPAPLLLFGSSSPFLLPTSDPCFFHSGSRRPCPAPASLPARPPDSRSILPIPSTSISQTSTPGPLPHASHAFCDLGGAARYHALHFSDGSAGAVWGLESGLGEDGRGGLWACARRQGAPEAQRTSALRGASSRQLA